MAPLSLMTSGFSLLAKSFSVFSCTNTLARCTGVFPAIQSLSTWKGSPPSSPPASTWKAGPPPKRPLNGYLMYVKQHRLQMARQHPALKQIELISKLAQQWRGMAPEQKKPFVDTALRAKEQYATQIKLYREQLSPIQAALMAEERRAKIEKRHSIRKKKELTSLGKPKRSRSAFNIYMAEHYERAKGLDLQDKMKSMTEEWKKLLTYQKRVYLQLADDDKVRYENEMKIWEDHMVELGRADLLRQRTLSRYKKAKRFIGTGRPDAGIAQNTGQTEKKRPF